MSGWRGLCPFGCSGPTPDPSVLSSHGLCALPAPESQKRFPMAESSRPLRKAGVGSDTACPERFPFWGGGRPATPGGLWIGSEIGG